MPTLPCSEDPKERTFAVNKIQKVSGRQDSGGQSNPARARKVPELSEEPTALKDLIEWDRAQEPLITCSFTREENKEVKD